MREKRCRFGVSVVWVLCERERESQRPFNSHTNSKREEKVNGESTEQVRRKMKQLCFGVGFVCSFAVAL